LANIASSLKKNRQHIKREARNRSQKAEMRTAIKKVRSALVAKDATKAKAALPVALKLLDRAGRKGLIAQNAASRTVSRLVSAVGGL
jgi:small subunit ribosomal protein S20